MGANSLRQCEINKPYQRGYPGCCSSQEREVPLDIFDPGVDCKEGRKLFDELKFVLSSGRAWRAWPTR